MNKKVLSVLMVFIFGAFVSAHCGYESAVARAYGATRAKEFVSGYFKVVI